MAADEIFFDGFDHYSTDEIVLKWDGSAGYNAIFNTIDQTSGRNGKGCLSTHQAYLSKNFTRVKYFCGGFALKMLDTDGTFLAINDTVGIDAALISLKWNSDNTISIFNPNAGTALGTTSGSFIIGDWYYIEFKLEVDSSTSSGWCQLRVDGTTVIDLTSQNTTWGSSSQANQVFVGSISGALNSFTCYIDDVVLQSGSGADYFGDVVIESLYPNADGTHTALALNGSVAGYTCVNEHPPDYDTTYISSSTVNDISTFQYSNTIETILTVKAIQTILMASKDGTGPRTIAPVFRISGTDYTGSDATLGSAYSVNRQIYLINPATGVAWTATEIANLESGVKVTS